MTNLQLKVMVLLEVQAPHFVFWSRSETLFGAIPISADRCSKTVWIC